MKTIVQEYGPIYGEVVNGTVLGRPNGSVFVPTTNTVSIALDSLYLKKWTASWGTKYYALVNSDGTGRGTLKFDEVAVSQDLSSVMEVNLYSDAALTTKIAYRTFAAGEFNRSENSLVAIDYDTPQTGDTLYLVANLVNNGVAVAATVAYEMELVE